MHWQTSQEDPRYPVLPFDLSKGLSAEPCALWSPLFLFSFISLLGHLRFYDGSLHWLQSAYLHSIYLLSAHCPCLEKPQLWEHSSVVHVARENHAVTLRIPCLKWICVTRVWGTISHELIPVALWASLISQKSCLPLPDWGFCNRIYGTVLPMGGGYICYFNICELTLSLNHFW